MIKEKANLSPKGIIKLEAYNRDGEVFKTVKRNLVVESANEIMAQALANPNKKVVAEIKETGNTLTDSFHGKGYPLKLKRTFSKEITGGITFSEDNENKIIEVPELAGAIEVTRMYGEVDEDGNEVELVEGVDFFINDEKKGILRFKEAQTKDLQFEAKVQNRRGYRVLKGSVLVKADGVEMSEGEKADSTQSSFVVDYDLGYVYFDTPRVNVDVSYKIEIPYGINFMALGGKPSPEWETGKPVQFSEHSSADRLALKMKGEIENTRVLLDFPDHISEGAPELDLGIKTQPIEKAEKVDSLTILPEGDGTDVKTSYSISNTYVDEDKNEGARLLQDIIEVKNETKGTDITDKVSVEKNTLQGIEIKIDSEEIEINDIVRVRYNLKVSNQHLIYKLGQSPVLKLLSVRHVDSNDSSKITEYKIEKFGLERGEGDVWISNSNLGMITFSDNPQGVDPSNQPPKVHTPGTLQVEYLVNSGSAVQFTADFPIGMPEAIVENDSIKTILDSGVVSVVLPDNVHINEEGRVEILDVVVDGITIEEHEYTVGEDNRTITLDAAQPGQEVEVTFKKEVSTFDVYQVAMFDEQKEGKMFNISGIGPIPKDKNTGIRVTWTVIF